MMNAKTSRGRRPPRRGLEWETLAFPLAVAVSMSVIALLEWWRWAWDRGYRPKSFALVAAVCVVWAALHFWRAVAQVRRVARGRPVAPGGTIAAQKLAGLQALGYRVFHDVGLPAGSSPGPKGSRARGEAGEDGPRVEHALVGPGGVFAIETRGARTPPGLTAVRYDGHAVRLNGQAPDRAPVAAAEEQATRLREILQGQGAAPPVRAVLLYDRWNVVGEGDADSAWVLNCKGLAERLAGWPRVLADGDVRRIADLLNPRARSGRVD